MSSSGSGTRASKRPEPGAPRPALGKLLHLEGDEHRRLLPFFLLYFLLFTALTIADGLSVSLFMKRVGAASLPRYYGAIAAANLVLVGGYVLIAERYRGGTVLCWIAAGGAGAFMTTWAGASWHGGVGWFGLLFVTREISYTLFLMHFGTFLQDYFTRGELGRVMPIVYAGGRLGGILGGGILERAGPTVGLVHLLLVCAGITVAGIGIALSVQRTVARVVSAEDARGDPGLAGGRGVSADELDRAARGSLEGFLRFIRRSPLMFWNTMTALLFVGCRWLLNFQYNTFFESHFEDEVTMAAFLGRYTQIALALSLGLQVLLVGRLVAWVGIKGAQLSYALLLVAGLGLNALSMTFPRAVFSRFLETELRFGLRNPINQLLINKFSKPLRVRVRAWSLGFLVPVATLATSAALTAMVGLGAVGAVGLIGGAAGAAYLFGIYRMNGTFSERPVAPPASQPEAGRPRAL